MPISSTEFEEGMASFLQVHASLKCQNQRLTEHCEHQLALLKAVATHLGMNVEGMAYSDLIRGIQAIIK